VKHRVSTHVALLQFVDIVPPEVKNQMNSKRDLFQVKYRVSFHRALLQVFHLVPPEGKHSPTKLSNYKYM